MLIDKCDTKIHSNNYLKENGTYFSSVLTIKYYNHYATNVYSNGILTHFALNIILILRNISLCCF